MSMPSPPNTKPPTMLIVAMPSSGRITGRSASRTLTDGALAACSLASSTAASIALASGLADMAEGSRHRTSGDDGEGHRVKQECERQLAEAQQDGRERRADEEGQVVQARPQAVGRSQAPIRP